MKISIIEHHPETNQPVEPKDLKYGLRSGINVLILAHFLLFILFSFLERAGFDMSSYFILGTSAQDTHSMWLTGLFTYHFVHPGTAELLLSMSMLWLFGHLLAEKIGEGRVLLLYFMAVTFSGVVFVVSHLVFPIFSGPGGLLNGAFGGVLVIMTIAALIGKSSQLHIGRRISIPVWQIYLAALLISFAVVYEHNMAFILIYIGSIYAAVKLVLSKEHPLQEDKFLRERTADTPQQRLFKLFSRRVRS